VGVKAQLRQQLLSRVGFDPQVWILDSAPVPVGRFGRADRCRRLAGLAAFGRDEGAKQRFSGLRAHLGVCWPGVITGRPTGPSQPAHLMIAEELLAGVQGGRWVIRRTGARPGRAAGRPGRVAAGPAVTVAKAPRPHLPGRLVQARRRIETVIGQLVERYHAKRVWARDAWHLWSRWQRKLLSHTLAVYLCQQTGLGSLRFADLITN
jgi:hypothetical protein